MDFEYSDEQKQLADALKRFIARDYGFETRKKIIASPEGWSESAWRTLAELGVLALPLPEAHDGFAGGAVDLMPVMEALGEGLVLEPVLPTILAARCVTLAGTDGQKQALLPGVATGDVVMSLAIQEAGARYSLSNVNTIARKTPGGWTLEGAKAMVLHGGIAHQLVVSARGSEAGSHGDGIGLFLVDAQAAGIRVSGSRAVDGMQAAEIVFDKVNLPEDALLGEVDRGLPILEAVADFGSALLCAEAVGVIAWANAQTLEYLKTRRQYGTTLGSFQALQHRMVEMMIAGEQARSMACLACVKVDGEPDPAQRSRFVSAARIRVNQAARLVSQEAVQMHGGIGMTEELMLSHAFRRLMVLTQQFGDTDYHKARFARLDRGG